MLLAARGSTQSGMLEFVKNLALDVSGCGMPDGSEVFTKIFGRIVHNGGVSLCQSYVQGVHLVSKIFAVTNGAATMEPSVVGIGGRLFRVE